MWIVTSVYLGKNEQIISITSECRSKLQKARVPPSIWEKEEEQAYHFEILCQKVENHLPALGRGHTHQCHIAWTKTI